MGFESSKLKATADVYIGLSDPSLSEWSSWYDAMMAERARVRRGERIDLSRYDDDEATRWSNRTFRQLFLFMYDTSFFDRDIGAYRTRECLQRWTAMFGRIDSVLLWHAYPRLGFDTRTQFDFYRDMPGGLAGLEREVCRVLHEHGVRVFVDYNPWAEGSYEDLGEIVAALDADGVMLDTMTDAPERLFRAVESRKTSGVVFAPELRPRDADLSILRQSWAQWSEVPANEPAILRHRWIVPKHRQLSIRRWDTSRREEIAFSFFNGSGLILWDNIFGSWNPYSREDRRLIAETAVLLEEYADVFVDGQWRPLIPTGDRDLDANEWTHVDGRRVVTLRNRSKERVIACGGGFWGDTIAPGGVNAIVTDPQNVERVRERFTRASRTADVALANYDERTPTPRRLLPAIRPLPSAARRIKNDRLVAIPGTKKKKYVMRVRHQRRECGCYELGTTTPGNVRWGWFYNDDVTHEHSLELPPFYMRRKAVTNREMLEFLRESKYEPNDGRDFVKRLRQLVQAPGGEALNEEVLEESVTWVSLDDARAFASFYGERLPTEEEWQWAAEQSPALVEGMTGGCWELTESEHDDGHTRFVMLRGGVFLPPDDSEWVIPRGPRPADFHAKYILLADSLDRSDTISFRTVK